MRRAKVYNHRIFAGFLIEEEHGYIFEYDEKYKGPPVSLTMPIDKKKYCFDAFPAFFDNLLPEGPRLEAFLNKTKLDSDDYFGQLLVVGGNNVGSVTIKEDK